MDGRWALREPGRQMLVFVGKNGELDLSNESGVFHVKTVNMRTGETTSRDSVQAGGEVKLPAATVVWLMKD